jgi:hypothetical protein
MVQLLGVQPRLLHRDAKRAAGLEPIHAGGSLELLGGDVEERGCHGSGLLGRGGGERRASVDPAPVDPGREEREPESCDGSDFGRAEQAVCE